MSDLLTAALYYGTVQDYTVDDISSVTISLGSEIKNNSMKVTVKNNPVGIFSDGTIKHRWLMMMELLSLGQLGLVLDK